MGIQYTTNYHIAYMDDQTTLDQLDDVTYQVATSLDDAMGRAGYTPPDATTFAALAARVTALEGAIPTALTLATGWQPYGSGRPELLTWRQGKTAFLQGFITAATGTTVPTGDKAVTAVGALPTASRLRSGVGTPFAFPLIKGGASVGRLEVRVDGSVWVSLTATVTPGEWLSLSGSWPTV